MRLLRTSAAFAARTLIPAAAFVLVSAVAFQSAYADFVVELERSDQSVAYRFVDNQVGDTNPAEGIIEVAIDEDRGWEFFFTATSKPLIGLETVPRLSLEMETMFVLEEWTIRVTDTDFVNDASTATAYLRGGVIGSNGIEFTVNGDDQNVEFGESFTLGTATLRANDSDRVDLIGATDAVGSLTLVMTVLQGSGGDSDAEGSFVAAVEVEAAGGGEPPPPPPDQEDPEALPISLPKQGTIDTEILFAGEGFGDKKNKVYAEFVNSKGKTKKKNLKILDWSDTRIRARWTADIDPQDARLFIQAKGGDPRDAGLFRVQPPVPDALDSNSEANGNQITVAGRFFGAGGAKPKLDFTYTNAKGKEVRAKLKNVKDAGTFNPLDGGSQLAATLPKLKDADLPATGVLRIMNKIGEAVVSDAFTINAPPPPAIDLFAPKTVTIGSRVAIRGEGFGSKKGKVYVEALNNKGKTKKKQLKVVSWSGNEISADWTEALAPGEYPLFIEAKSFAALQVGTLTVQGPQSLDVAEDVARPGTESTVNGRYMGTKSAKPKLVFTYTNAKGKTVNFNVKLFKDTILFDNDTGDGTISFQVPKLKAKDLPATGTLTFSNKVGEAAVADTLTVTNEVIVE